MRATGSFRGLLWICCWKTGIQCMGVGRFEGQPQCNISPLPKHLFDVWGDATTEIIRNNSPGHFNRLTHNAAILYFCQFIKTWDMHRRYILLNRHKLFDKCTVKSLSSSFIFFIVSQHLWLCLVFFRQVQSVIYSLRVMHETEHKYQLAFQWIPLMKAIPLFCATVVSVSAQYFL